ncbi:amidohydrolase family protein, partial [Protofrankia coriariae]|uniref:amidohydrolase family protein n=1 Tax=Protofrankia coriariae TaxID=1562887 RepID=UPI000A32243D
RRHGGGLDAMTSLDEATVLDIHTHWQPTGWTGWSNATWLAPGEPDPREDLAGLAAESRDAGVDLRALSAPLESLFGPDGDVEPARVNAVNEYLAERLDPHDRFLGLATVDAYAGEAGAEQARYAIEELGLHGLVLDSSRYGKFPGSPEAFPALELAARLGVPVFVHPVQSPRAEVLRQAAGWPGNSAGRGLENGVAFLSALHADLPTRLPDLHLVFTALGHGALLYAVDELAEHCRRLGDGSAGANIYFDTMRFSAPLLAYFGAVLGAERIIIGSDWPIHRDAAQPRIDDTLAAAGFDAREQELIRIGNARRLFQLRGARHAVSPQATVGGQE